ncbi:MAG: glycosyltransferase [Hyphomicrobium sp.]|nr:glycosyltransferase [Hyphomicrobium sp.]
MKNGAAAIGRQGPRLAVIFDNFGPYHVARIDALGAVTPTLGVEVAARSQVYQWDKVERPTRFERRTLFEVADSRQVDKRDLASALVRALEDFRPDVVLVPGWATTAAISATRWCLARRVPTVLMSESTFVDAPRSGWKEHLKSRIVRLHDAGLVGGAPQKAYLAQLGIADDAIRLGYNAIDNDYFAVGSVAARANERALRERYLLPERYFLASARFIAIKNLDRLLVAFRRFRESRPTSSARLVLLGDGAEAGALRALRSELELDAHVLMPGFKQYGDLPVYYGLALGFVHVSRIEPWGLVVNEAMASGLPVIVSSVCGCAADLVREGENGYIVRYDDVDAIAQRFAALDDLPDSARVRMGEASANVVGEYGPQRFASGALAAANAAIAGGQRSRRSLDRMVAASYAWAI